MPAPTSFRAKRTLSSALNRGVSNEMITKKSKVISSTAIWPYTPEPSPPLEPTPILLPVEEDLTMSAEDLARSRPISVASKRDGTFSPGARPTLQDVLDNRAPSPYTLAAYTAFLSQQHCLEVLEFTIEAKKYSTKYEDSALMLAGMPFNTDTDEGFELMQEWIRLMDVFVKPGAPREINLPAEERDDLVDWPYEPKPPPPEALEPSVKRMYDLMSDSIFIPFCNSLKPTMPHAHTFSTASELSTHDMPRHTFSERLARPQQRPRKRSPPLTSGAPLEPTRSPTSRPGGTSALTSALNRTSSARLSTHISHSSAASDSAMTDDSSVGYSPAAPEPEMFISPPTTPPQSDLPFHSGSSRNHLSTSAASKTGRPDSSGGTWKKMGMKFFGGNKKK